jgi:hypothetical protein
MILITGLLIDSFDTLFVPENLFEGIEWVCICDISNTSFHRFEP